jgi:PhzF family phenazine biosynthesis protein
MGQRIIQVDAFTDRPFAGNPAAVCVLDGPAEAGWMQQVASEMNLAETAFLYREGDAFRLRWFTPTVEVDICGHATIASAHVLWEEGHLPQGTQARFATLSGLLTADQREGGWVELNFPVEQAQSVDPPPDLIDALDVMPVFAGRNRVDYLIEVASERIVREIQPNFTLLRTIPTRGVIVTSRSDNGEHDFVSRFFAPASGIDEDPVTGSSHCCLTPYWAERLVRDNLIAYQASSRGGVIRLRLDGDRVRISGQAVTVLRGELV